MEDKALATALRSGVFVIVARHSAETRNTRRRVSAGKGKMESFF